MSLKWEHGHVKGKLSKKAVEGGKDSDGSVIFVGRAYHNGVFIPAKIIPSKNACYIAYNGAEVFVETFEVLTGEKNFSWEPASDGRVAAGAVSTGREGNDEIFIGRAPFQGSMTVGKIHPSHRCLYFPFNGREERTTHYEVLVHKKGSKLAWIQTTAQSTMPRDAVLGGRDTDGAQIYVGRAEHQGDLLPCKVMPSKKIAFISHNGAEIAKHNFDILVGSDVKWKKERNGKIPKDSYPGGRTSSGEVLYIGRAEHNRSQTIGKVHPSHGCLYIPYGGKEIPFKDYEVLTGN